MNHLEDPVDYGLFLDFDWISCWLYDFVLDCCNLDLSLGPQLFLQSSDLVVLYLKVIFISVSRSLFAKSWLFTLRTIQNLPNAFINPKR